MKWISVKDELPEERRYVLTWHPIDKNIFTRYQTEGEFFNEDGRPEYYDKTTCWMPLPEPPKDKQ